MRAAKATTKSSERPSGALLAWRLSALLDAEVEVVVTDNIRTMLSWRERPGGVLLRCHAMFVDAPNTVIEAIAAQVSRPRRAANRVLSEYIEANRHMIRSGRDAAPALRTAGRYHDLAAVLAHLNRLFFDGSFDGDIGWGRRAPSRRRRTIRLGSYSPSQRLIRIHPALDRDFVPRYFVEWVVYHEMLHQVVPMPKVRGRRRCHSAEFRRREALFPDAERAREWERQNISRLLAR